MVEFLTQVLHYLREACLLAIAGFTIFFVVYILIMDWLPGDDDELET